MFIHGLLALATVSGPAKSQQITVRSDSSGVEIVTSDPSLSEASCTLGDEPVFRVGDDDSNEATWFSTIRGMGRLSDGSVAVLDRSSAEVRIFDPDGRHVRSMGRRGGMYQLFTASALVQAGGSTIALGRTTEPEVRLLDDKLRLRRILRWPDSDRDVSRADVRAWRDDYIERRGGRNSPNWRPSDEEVVSGEVPTAGVFPAFSYVEIGRDGRVWVLPYRKPREKRRRWMGFEPDGAFLCHLENSHTGLDTYEFGARLLAGLAHRRPGGGDGGGSPAEDARGRLR